MGKYAVGTVVQSTEITTVKYEYAPRDSQDDRPWRAIDVPAIIILLMGDENNEVRFNTEDIQESIDAGELIIIHTP